MQKEFYSGKHLNNAGAKSKAPLVLHFVLLNLHQGLPASLEQPSKRNINQLNFPISNRLELNAIYINNICFGIGSNSALCDSTAF